MVVEGGEWRRSRKEGKKGEDTYCSAVGRPAQRFEMALSLTVSSEPGGFLRREGGGVRRRRIQSLVAENGSRESLPSGGS
jgi:hypothetical protein